MKKIRVVLVLITIISILIGVAVFLLTGGMEHDVSPLVALGEKYLEEGDYEQAELQFERAIAISEKSPEAWYGSARASIGLGNDEEAIKALKTVAELDPSQKDKIDWMIEKIKAGEGMDLILLAYGDPVPTASGTPLSGAQDGASEEPLFVNLEGDVMSAYGVGYKNFKDAYLQCIDAEDPNDFDEKKYLLTDLNGDNQPELIVHYNHNTGSEGIFVYLFVADTLKEFSYDYVQKAGVAGYDHNTKQVKLNLSLTGSSDYSEALYSVEKNGMLYVATLYQDQNSMIIYGADRNPTFSYEWDDYTNPTVDTLDEGERQWNQMFTDDGSINTDVSTWLTKDEVIVAINAM